MGIRTLEEDFRRMGLSDNEIRASLTNMLGESAEADSDQDVTEEDFEEDGYLGDVVDMLAEKKMQHRAGTKKKAKGSVHKVRTHKTKSSKKMYNRSYRAKHRSEQEAFAKTPAMRAKRAASRARLAKMGPAKHGQRRRLGTDTGDMYDSSVSIQEALLESINDLAQSIDHDPTGRFDEYVTAFNHIADLGELGAMKIMDEDEEAACDVIRVALEAEDVLKAMEEMDGALTVEEDEILEGILADAMEDVATTLETYGLFEGCKKRNRKGQDDDEEDGEDEEDVEEDVDEIDEQDEEDDEDEEEDDEEDVDEDVDEDISESASMLMDAAEQLREAKGPKAEKKPPKSKKRMLVVNGKLKSVSTPSRWSKMNRAPGASKKQVMLRKDVRKQEALLGYLKKVKAGTVAPGMHSSGKGLSKGAAKAVAAARVKK